MSPRWGVTLPSSVACIGDLAFQYCEKLTGLSLSSSLTSIGGWSFQNCTGIVSPLALPEGLTAIADGAFSGCSGLTGNLVLPSTLTSLGRWVFSGCTGFSGYLQIPGSLPGIADATFYDCNGLTDIYYAGTADEWHAVAPNPGPYNGAALHFGAAVSASGWFGTGNPFLWILDSRGHLLVRGSGDMESFWDDQDIPWYPYRQDIFRLTVTPGVTGIGAKEADVELTVTLRDDAAIMENAAEDGAFADEGNLSDAIHSAPFATKKITVKVVKDETWIFDKVSSEDLLDVLFGFLQTDGLIHVYDTNGDLVYISNIGIYADDALIPYPITWLSTSSWIGADGLPVTEYLADTASIDYEGKALKFYKDLELLYQFTDAEGTVLFEGTMSVTESTDTFRFSYVPEVPFEQDTTVTLTVTTSDGTPFLNAQIGIVMPEVIETDENGNPVEIPSADVANAG